jgi:hypothetical protein
VADDPAGAETALGLGRHDRVSEPRDIVFGAGQIEKILPTFGKGEQHKGGSADGRAAGGIDGTCVFGRGRHATKVLI